MADASERRWKVTLARWSAARAHPVILTGLYDSSAGAGVGAFFGRLFRSGQRLRWDATIEDLCGALSPEPWVAEFAA